MTENFTVLEVAQREMANNGNAQYNLKLQSPQGIYDDVYLQQKTTTAAPVVGEVRPYDLEQGNNGWRARNSSTQQPMAPAPMQPAPMQPTPQLVAPQQAVTAGVMQPPSQTQATGPADKREAQIVRQHSQEMGIRTVRIAVENGIITKPTTLDELHNSILKSTQHFYADTWEQHSVSDIPF